MINFTIKGVQKHNQRFFFIQECVIKRAVQTSVHDPCTQSVFTHQVGVMIGKLRVFMGFDLKPKDPDKLKSVDDSVNLGLTVFGEDLTFEHAGKVEFCVVALSKHTYVTGMTQRFQNCAQIRFKIFNTSLRYEKR